MVNFVEMFGSPFDASAIDPNSGGGNLPVSGPDGILVVITSSELKPAKGNENNMYLELIVEAIEGTACGETGKIRLNLVNDNDAAVRIAQRDLSAICRVTGVWNPETSEQLHGIPFRVVTVEKKYTGSDGKEYSGSEIKKFLDQNGNAPVSDGNGNGNGNHAPAPSNKPSFASAPPAAAPTAPPPTASWKPNPPAATGNGAPPQPKWGKK